MSLAEPMSPSNGTLPGMLAAVRRRIRAYVAVEGLGATVATAALGFWAALGIDWFFEPPRPVRLAVLGVVGLVVLVVVWRRLLRRVFARLADRHIALIVERRYRDLNDALLTTIELDPAKQTDYGRAMLADTRVQAERRLARASLGELFDPRPRARAVAAALLGAATIAGFALAVPELFQLGVRRLTAQTDEGWPRRTALSIVGFDDGEKVVAQGSDVEITVRADAAKFIPPDVYLRYRSDDGVRDEQPLEREGVARPGVDEFQNYKFTFRGVSSSLTMDVLGGDARLRGLRLRVVERPQLRLRLACKYPPYAGRADGEIDVTGAVPLPQGTHVTVVAAANKPLRTVVVNRPEGRGGAGETRLDLAADGTADREFRFEVGRLMVDEMVTFSLHDDDGIDNTAALSLQAVVDTPPVLAVYRRGLEMVATPQARIPFVGKASDDYGLARMWFEYSLANGEPARLPTVVQPAGARELEVELREAFPSAPLEPGQTLSVAVRADDNRELAELPGGNVATGDTAVLTIVTDAELLRLLEACEIMFREQFKALIEKVTRSRDGLVSLGEAAAPPAAGEPAANAGDVPVNRDIVLIEQTRTRAKEQRIETLQVADGFGLIVDELVNNRAADGDRLRERLAEDIVKPLRRIGEGMFADYESRLVQLHAAAGRQSPDAAQVGDLRRETTASADAILVEMQVVLGKMQELESFKEAIDLLKAIIAMQKDVGEQTKKSRVDKSRLLDLLE